MADRGGERTFDFAFEPSYRRVAALFGVTPESTGVRVDGEKLRARFGRWRVSTPLANIEQVRLTGPYAWLKTAGPARLTVSDRGLTFATNSQRGVEIHFHEKVAGIEPSGRLRHPNLTLTVADVEGLYAVLQARKA